jgi:multiple sugar transport system substrate-binding protein
MPYRFQSIKLILTSNRKYFYPNFNFHMLILSKGDIEMQKHSKKMFRQNALIKAVTLLTLAILLVSCAPVATPATTVPVESTVAIQQPTEVVQQPTEVVQQPTEAPTTGKQVTLTYWQVPNYGDMKGLVEGLLKPFEASHPNIKVDVVVIPWSDVNTMWTSAIQSGETPDVGYVLTPEEMYRLGGLEPLDGYLDKEFLSQFLQSPLKAGVMDDGKLYTLPLLVSSDVLYYNKDMFQKAGIPLPAPLYSPTWEEFLDWNIKLKAAGYYGWDWGLRTEWDHTIWDVYHRFGVNETNADYTKVTFDTPEALNWAKAVQDLAQKYKVLPPKALTLDWNRSESFLQGESAMVEYWAGLADTIAKDYPNLNYGVIKPFHGPGNGGTSTGDYLALGSNAVFKDSKNKAEAVELLKYLASSDFVLPFNKAVGTFPAVAGGNSIFNDAPAQKKAVTDVIWSQLESGEAAYYYAWPGVQQWATESFLPNWQALMLGKMTPEDFVRKVNDDGNRIITSQ